MYVNVCFHGIKTDDNFVLDVKTPAYKLIRMI